MAETLQLTAAKAGCVVSVSHSRITSGVLGPQPQGPWSSSGVILTQNPSVAICHGAIFSPFLLGADRQDWPQRRVLLADSFTPDVQIQVLVPAECSRKTSHRNSLGGDLGGSAPAVRFSPLSNRPEVQSGLRHHEAELIMMVPCLQFQNAFSQVFSASDQWHFGGNEIGQGSSSLLDDFCSLHWFALLRILDCAFHGGGCVGCVPAKSLRKGDPLFACGSPFGSFCPDIFMNTLSKGVVSNLVGDSNALILTDARCLPGTEGGAMFAVSGTSLSLVGIIVAPLCWKSNEWVGLTLGCAVDCILESIASATSGPHKFLKTWLKPRQLVSTTHGEMVARDGLDQQIMTTVVLVECGPTWGSGVMVSPRLVLTCRHVVNGASSVCVRLQPSPEKTSVAKGKVVFATKDSSPYDVALVELEESISTFSEPLHASKFYAGEDVSIIGFGAFGQACGPSVTSGILSAVNTVEDKPVMLQATCAVHSGSSGGALVSTRSGKLLGIVASNTKDHSVGATYPHLNFSIPITVVQTALLDYIRTRNLSSFRELNRVDDRVRDAWRLQRDPAEVPLSKL